MSSFLIASRRCAALAPSCLSALTLPGSGWSSPCESPEPSHLGHIKPLKWMIFPLSCLWSGGQKVLSPVSPSLSALPSKRMNLWTEERRFTKKPTVPFADHKLEGFVSLFHSPAPFVLSLFILMFLCKSNICEQRTRTTCWSQDWWR